jgi:hypothetical protein
MSSNISNMSVSSSASSSTRAFTNDQGAEEKSQSGSLSTTSSSSHNVQKAQCIIPKIDEEKISTITIEYFRKALTQDPDHISLAPTLVFFKHKWTLLRKEIKKGQQGLIFKETPQIKSVKTLIKLIQRSLIVLRLLPQTNNQTPPSFSFDITPLVTPLTCEALHKEFPLIEKKNKWIIPCQRKIELHNEDKKALTPSSKMIRDAIDVLPNDMQGEIMSYLEPSRVEALLPYSANPAFAQRFSKQFSELVQSSVRKALIDYKENQILSFSEDIKLIRLYVRKLDLSNIALSPFAIIQLALYFPNIQELNLSECDNTDAAIRRLGYFSKLESLNISKSDATGMTFGGLPKSIKKLDCSTANHLREEAVFNLEHCNALEELSFQNTLICGRYFDHLPESLKTFDISWCFRLYDSAFSSLSRCKNLTKLSITKTGTLGRHFETFPKSLKTLVCKMCPLNDDAILNLSHCHDLTTLLVDNTPITGKYFSHLSKSLKQLTCGECPITDEAILDLTHCDQLIELTAYGTPITGKYFHMLPKSLKIADFSRSKITDDAILKLQGCTSLESLRVSDTSIQGTHLDALPKSLIDLYCFDCPQLKKDVKKNLKKSRPFVHIGL